MKSQAKIARKRPNTSKAKWKKPQVKRLGRVDEVVQDYKVYPTPDIRHPTNTQKPPA